MGRMSGGGGKGQICSMVIVCRPDRRREDEKSGGRMVVGYTLFVVFCLFLLSYEPEYCKSIKYLLFFSCTYIVLHK